jgi:hypothetical protein
MSLSELMRGITDDYVNGTRVFSRSSAGGRKAGGTSNEEAKNNG